MTDKIKKEIEAWAAQTKPTERQKKESKEMQKIADDSLKEVKEIQSWAKTKMPIIMGETTITNPLKP